MRTQDIGPCYACGGKGGFDVTHASRSEGSRKDWTAFLQGSSWRAPCRYCKGSGEEVKDFMACEICGKKIELPKYAAIFGKMDFLSGWDTIVDGGHGLTLCSAECASEWWRKFRDRVGKIYAKADS